jgi:hypothetical protein
MAMQKEGKNDKIKFYLVFINWMSTNDLALALIIFIGWGRGLASCRVGTHKKNMFKLIGNSPQMHFEVLRVDAPVFQPVKTFQS